MARYHTFAGEAHFGRIGYFRPKGPLEEHGEDGVIENPTTRIGGGGLSARLFVGLNVDDEETWTPEDIVELIIKIRKKQKKRVDATILSQRGLYTNRQGKIIDEPSVQIIIIDMEGLKKKAFVKQMTKLAETLAEKLDQDSVLLEIQKRGIVTDLYEIT